MGTFSNILQLHLDFSIPSYREGLVKELLLAKSDKKGQVIVVAFTNFKVEEYLIEGNISIVFEVDSLNKIFAGHSLSL